MPLRCQSALRTPPAIPPMNLIVHGRNARQKCRGSRITPQDPTLLRVVQSSTKPTQGSAARRATLGFGDFILFVIKLGSGQKTGSTGPNLSAGTSCQRAVAAPIGWVHRPQ